MDSWNVFAIRRLLLSLDVSGRGQGYLPGDSNTKTNESPGRYQELDLFIKVLRLLCPNLTDASLSLPYLFLSLPSFGFFFLHLVSPRIQREREMLIGIHFLLIFWRVFLSLPSLLLAFHSSSKILWPGREMNQT